MSLFLTNIYPEIYDSLKFRQDHISDRTIGWFNDKTVWIRMTSLAKVGDDADFRLKWVLTSLDAKSKGGISLYGNRNRPFPGITNATIQNKGTAGSFREAQVSFVCWTIEQLEALELIYMTPGISVLLEWGWNKTIQGDLIHDNLSSQSPMFDACVASIAKEKTLETGGHFDAMQGIITNWNWTARDDGGFDCSTTFCSLSESWMTMSTKSKSKNILRRGVKAEEGKPASYEENVLATLFTTLETLEKNEIIKDSEGIYGCKIKIESSDSGEETSNFQDARKERLTGIVEKAKFWFDTKIVDKYFGDEDNYFVTWNFFETYIINANLSMIPEEIPTPSCETATVKNTLSGKILFPTLYNKETLINYRRNVVSSDPFVCILPAVEITCGDSSGAYYDIPSGFNKVQDGNKIYLKDILLNMKFIYSVYESTTTLNDFTLGILNGISDACGGFWQFGLMGSETEQTVVQVVDNMTVEEESPTPFKFKNYHKDSILLGISLTTEVSNEFKGQMLYGVNRDRTMDSESSIEKDTEGTTEYNFYGRTVTNLASNKLRTPKANELGKYDTDGSSGAVALDYTDYDKYLNIAFNDLFKKRTPDTTRDCQKALNKYLIEKTKQNNITFVDKRHGILPINLTVTIDGIGGLLFGNVIDIDYKPSRYDSDVYFQIKGIKHTIDGNTWKTDIETFMRPTEGENFSPFVTKLSGDESKKISEQNIYGSTGDYIGAGGQQGEL